MPYRLNEHNVHEGMYLRAKDVISRGGKVFLTVPTLNLEEDEERTARLAQPSKVYCNNCDGTGKLYLTVFIGGPFATPAEKKHVTQHEGKWYEQDVIMFVCPDCNGSGLFSRQAPRPDPVSL
jgi:hypothetical protein